MTVPLKDQIDHHMKQAMKDRDKDKVSTLRMAASAIKNKMIEKRPHDLTDEDVLSVLRKLSKQRQEAMEQFRQAGREDLAEKEEKELNILKEYLPAAMGEEQLREIVIATISQLGASSMKDMGQVMAQVIKKTKGASDNKQVSELVKAQLS